MPFGFLDRHQNRSAAVLVLKDADAQVEFVYPLVLPELADDVEQRIGEAWLQLLEHHCLNRRSSARRAR